MVIHHDNPELLVGARCQTPLVVGIGEGETFLASSITAFLRETRRVQFIDDHQVVAITPERRRLPRAGRQIVDTRGPPRSTGTTRVAENPGTRPSC